MADLASTLDIEAQWRALSADEASRAEALISAASRRLRALYADLDSRILSGGLDGAVVADIVVAMVKRALIGASRDGIESYSQTAGPFATTQKFSNPDGALYLTADEKAMLLSPDAVRTRTGWLA